MHSLAVCICTLIYLFLYRFLRSVVYLSHVYQVKHAISSGQLGPTGEYALNGLSPPMFSTHANVPVLSLSHHALLLLDACKQTAQLISFYASRQRRLG